MTDNTKVNSYQDQLLDSFGIIAEQIISNLSFDKTIVCVIVDDSRSSFGEYVVKYDNATFKVYSNGIEYRENDSVYVNIPNGNFENEKFIVGKKIVNKNMVYNYIDPFEKLLDLTGNLISNNQIISLTSNDEKNKEKEIIDINLEKLGINIINYTWLGISADFKSIIQNAISGSYGIKIKITTKNDEEYYDFFDSSKFFGNVYNFVVFTTQKFLINIKNLENIKNITLSFYQNNNFFQSNGEKVQYLPDMPPNLFINNIYLCAGKDSSEFTDELLEIYSQDGQVYSANITNLNLGIRWIYNKNDKIVNVYDEKDIPDGHQIRWYRYDYNNSSSDKYAGKFWTEIKSNVNKLTYNLQPNLNLLEEKLQAIVINNGMVHKRSQILNLKNEANIGIEQEIIDFSQSLIIEVEDGTNGNYFIYNEFGNINNDSEANVKRKLIPKFKQDNGKYEVLNLDQIDNIQWTFPVGNSMLYLINDKGEKDDNQISESIKPEYKIEAKYKQNFTNNTVICEVTKNGKIYQANKTFSFAPKYQLNDGYVMKIVHLNNIDCPFVFGSLGGQKLEVEIYDEKNNKLSNLNSLSFTWSLVNQSANDFFQFDQNKANIVTLNQPNGFSTSDCYIVRVVENASQLMAYYPIALSADIEQYSYSTGALEVVYLQNGQINFSQEYYKLYNNQDEEEQVAWQLLPENSGWLLKDNKLIPSNVYIKNINYYLQVKENNEVVFVQPILNIQNVNTSTILNSTETNIVENIINPFFSSLSYNSDNGKYSGLLVGTYNNQQGIFGFDQNGQVILEINESGKIKIDGKELYIENSYVKAR